MLNRAHRQKAASMKATLICMCSTKAFEKTDDLLEDRYLKAERVMIEVGKLYESGAITLDNLYKCRDVQIKTILGAKTAVATKTSTHIMKKPARPPCSPCTPAPPLQTDDDDEKSEAPPEDDEAHEHEEEGEEEEDEENEEEKETTPEEPEPSPKSPTDSLPGASVSSDSSDFFALPACTGFSP